MDLSLLSMHTVIAFLLVLCRIGGMLVSAPLFNMRTIPPQAKIGLAVVMALLIFPLHSSGFVIPKDLIQFALLAIQESILGLLIGFIANLTFMAVQMAGEFISTQMGLSMAQVLDPVTGVHAPMIGQFFFYLAAIVFLTLNIHHGLILGVERSFDAIPLGQFFDIHQAAGGAHAATGAAMTGSGQAVGGMGGAHALLTGGQMAERFIRLTGDMFILALMVGVPVMGLLLLTEIAVGFVAKVMPQMNVFMVAIPVKVGLGLLLILVSLPYLTTLLGDKYADLLRVLMGIYRA